MNFYIDFEANKDKEIISIGCISESGKKFYSLVKPHSKLDHMIQRLTGITQEGLDNALPAEEVFSNFLHFVFTSRNRDVNNLFFVYGNNDKNFISKTKEVNEDYLTKRVLDYISDNLIDCSKVIARAFGRKSVALERAYLAINGEKVVAHNALNDAMMLKYVWENYKNYEIDPNKPLPKIEKPDLKYGKSLKEKYADHPKYSAPIVYIRSRGVTKFNSVFEAMSVLNKVSWKKEKKMSAIISCCDNSKNQINANVRGYKFRWAEEFEKQ